jgi:hypothetical protein
MYVFISEREIVETYSRNFSHFSHLVDMIQSFIFFTFVSNVVGRQFIFIFAFFFLRNWHGMEDVVLISYIFILSSKVIYWNKADSNFRARNLCGEKLQRRNSTFHFAVSFIYNLFHTDHTFWHSFDKTCMQKAS